jgi:maleylacetate reductase
MANALPAIAADPSNVESRSDALYAAWLAGACLGSVGMALHHKLCHTLGGTFNLPHAETHAAVLPHALAYNAPAAPEAIARIGKAMETDDPPLALYQLAKRLGATMALRDLGMPEGAIDHATDVAMSNPYWNPRPLERKALRKLLEVAFLGMPP